MTTLSWSEALGGERGSPLAASAPEPQPSPEPERQALEALDQGDPRQALTLLMDAYGTPLYRFCLRMVGEETLAEDVMQMTFVQAYESLPRFAGRSSLRTWLFGIARHRALDALKITRRRHARFHLVAEPPESPDGEAGAEQRLASRSTQDVLADCLARLAPAARTALVLRFQEDVSYPEMARICGERAPTLQARVARALPVLRRCLESQGHAP